MRLAMLSNSARPRGIFCWGSPGAGKTRFMSRVAWQDGIRGIPTLVIDPIGKLTDQILSKASEYPKALNRIHYVDMSGKTGYITPFPLYHRFHGETLYQASSRFLKTIRLNDPALLQAPVNGYNPIYAIGAPLGMIFSVLDLPITEAMSLLANPESWKETFNRAINQNPKVAPAVAFFNKDYKTYTASQIQAFRIKVEQFFLEPNLAAAVAPGIGIDWVEFVEEGKTVILDFRDVGDESKSFLTLWVLKQFQGFMMSRKADYHSTPISLVIDELKTLFTDPHSEDGDSAFADELIQLIDVYARNFRVSSVFAAQDPLSFGEKARQSLLGMGTHVIGPIANTDAALLLARSLFTLDPKKVKHHQPIYGTPNRFSINPDPPILDYRPEYMTLDEQVYATAQRIKSLSPFHFLVRPAISEGAISSRVYPIRIDHIDAGRWPDPLKVGQLRQELSRTRGVAVQPVTIQPDHTTLNPHDRHREHNLSDADDDTDDVIR